ncbi:MAG: NAD(P)-dependent oxidoreductase, partial [Mycobacterium sp.]|nr:NAD(P)-dependent oxidoreductase [Mycobacterium sp.]
MKVGFIGAGRMGRPMVARLVEAGHDVRVLGRSAEKRAAIAQLGAKAVADTADLAAQTDAVVVCVFTDEQVQQVCLDGDLLKTMESGSAIVVHTTGNPRTVEAIAAHVASHDIGVVDAPVSGGPHNAAAGALTLFVGGADDAVARVRPVLSCYGDPVLHVGALGAGQKVKLVNNALFAAHIGLLSSAVELGARLGVPESTL